jgi:hypothetical protein
MNLQKQLGKLNECKMAIKGELGNSEYEKNRLG